MIANATKKHELSGLQVGVVNYYDTWCILGGSIFAIEYLIRNVGDDVRSVVVDDSWGYPEHWPYIDSAEEARWANRCPSKEYIESLVRRGLLVRLPEPWQLSDDGTNPIWGYRHVDSRCWEESRLLPEVSAPEFRQEDFALCEGWVPKTSYWYLDQTDRVRVSLNAFVGGTLQEIMLDGRGCALAMFRMFQRKRTRHRVAVGDVSGTWPFEEGSWADLDSYVDITMNEIDAMIRDRSLLIRPGAGKAALRPNDLVHGDHKEAARIWG